jgi:hypothetical protein
MSDPILAALITLFGAAFLAPLVNRVIVVMSEKRAQLRVNFSVQDFEIPNNLRALVEKHVHQLEKDNRAIEPLKWFNYVETVWLLEITNTSKKKINGVTITANVGTGFYEAENEADLRQFENKKLITIGDIQPGHSKTLRIWSNINQSSFYYSELKDSFHVVSADELDRIIYKYPIPDTSVPTLVE